VSAVPKDSPDESLIDRLSGIPLFVSLDREALARIAEIVDPFDAPAGHVLVQPGTVGSGLFLIEDGTVALSVHDKDVELGHGEFFGELALLDDRATRTTRVRARTAVTGYCIGRDAFVTLLEAEPRIPLAMLRVLAHRLVDAVTA
jgi:monovalent cation:H+ antiporter, CPA1 family